MALILTPEAEAEYFNFIDEYGYGGSCSCCISPPCGSCTHPGNPCNQECDETAWMEEWLGFDEMEKEAQKAVADVIEYATIRHLKEMKEMYGSE